MDNEEEGSNNFVGNFDFASLYPTTMRDYSNILIEDEILRKNRDEVVNELLGIEEKIETPENKYLKILKDLYKERIKNKSKNG